MKKENKNIKTIKKQQTEIEKLKILSNQQQKQTQKTKENKLTYKPTTNKEQK